MSKKTCEICSLDKNIIDSIAYDYSNGISIDDISIKYFLSPDKVKKHCEICASSHKTTAEKYIALIEDLESALEISKTALQDRPNSPGLQQSYAKLVDTYKDLLKESDGLRDPEETVKDLISVVINPLLQSIVYSLTKELDLLKSDLSKQGIANTKIDTLIADSFARLGKGLKDLLLVSLKNLNGYYNVEIAESDVKENSSSNDTVNLH